MHVHHGLSANADAWAAFCAAECAKRGVPLVVHRARVERRGGMSLEAAARAARYAALADGRRRLHRARAPRRRPGRRRCCCSSCAARDRTGSRRCRGGAPRDRGRRCCGRCSRFRARRSTRTRARARSRGSTTSRTPTPTSSATSSATRSRLASPRRFPAIRRRSRAAPRIRPRPRSSSTSSPRMDARRRDRRGSACAGATLDRAALDRARRAARRTARATCCAGSCGGTTCGHRRRRASRRCTISSCARRPTRACGSSTAGAEIGIHRGRIVVHPPAIAAFAIPWRGEPRLALPHGTLEFAAGRRRRQSRAQRCPTTGSRRARAGRRADPAR